jgi:hypothetical protein
VIKKTKWNRKHFSVPPIHSGNLVEIVLIRLADRSVFSFCLTSRGFLKNHMNGIAKMSGAVALNLQKFKRQISVLKTCVFRSAQRRKNVSRKKSGICSIPKIGVLRIG